MAPAISRHEDVTRPGDRQLASEIGSDILPQPSGAIGSAERRGSGGGMGVQPDGSYAITFAPAPNRQEDTPPLPRPRTPAASPGARHPSSRQRAGSSHSP